MAEGAEAVPEMGQDLKDTDPKKVRYPCDSCPRSFLYGATLNQHVATVHDNTRDFKCQLCNRAFGRDFHLRTHMKVKHGESPFRCSTCSKTFSCESRLTRHLDKKHGDGAKLKDDSDSLDQIKPEQVETSVGGAIRYKCDRCPRTFQFKRVLLKHAAVAHETNSEEFKCAACDKVFEKSHSLKMHLKFAHEEKTISCPSCPMAFRIDAHLA